MTEETQTAMVQQAPRSQAMTVAKDETITKEKIMKYLDTLGCPLENEMRESFVEIAQAHNLNPFKREIYGIPYFDKKKKRNVLSIVTGYEVYLKRAEDCGMLDGWKVWIEGEDMDMIAKILIYRKDRSHPFEWEVEFREYDQAVSQWNAKPKTMIKKVVIGQGFRLCFPKEYDGLPYLMEEIQVENQSDDVPVSRAIVEEEPDRESPASKETLDKITELLQSEFIDEKTEKKWLDALKAKTPTQEDAEKSIANLNAVIRRNTKVAEQEAADAKKRGENTESAQPDPGTPDPSLMVKKMHVLGVKIHGDKWDAVRKDMVSGINKDKTSSKDLDPAEMSEMINRLELEEQESSQ